MKKVWSFLFGTAIPLVLAAILLLTGVLQLGGEKRIEGKGYASPEEAVEAFGRYLQKGDLEGMLSTFAMESYLENRDLDNYLSYMSYSVNYGQFYSGTLPANSSLARDLDLEGRRAAVSEEICEQCLYLLLRNTPYEWIDGPYQLHASFGSETVEAALAALGEQGKLSGVQVLRGYSLEELLPAEKLTERYYKNMEKRALIYGPDEYREAALLLRINGEEYYLGMAVVRYGNRWYNMYLDMDLRSYLGVDYARTALVPVSEAKVGRQR